MDENNSSALIEKENYAKKMKRSFDSWREIVLHVNAVLLWKKQPYPWIIVAIPTVLFLELVYYDPSFLTAVSLMCILITLLDYVGPIISSAVWKQDSWTAVKEKELEDVCKALAEMILAVKHYWVSIKDMKTSRPNTFYPSTIVCFAALAWIGNSVNNLLITYLVVLLLLLLPGLIHYGIIQKCHQTVMVYVSNIIHSLGAAPTKKFH